MHINHLKRAITRTRKQIAKHKLKMNHSREDKDKKSAIDELKRLRDKMIMLQGLSNKRG